jgi:hypothetical protein
LVKSWLVIACTASLWSYTVPAVLGQFLLKSWLVVRAQLQCEHIHYKPIIIYIMRVNAHESASKRANARQGAPKRINARYYARHSTSMRVKARVYSMHTLNNTGPASPAVRSSYTCPAARPPVRPHVYVHPCIIRRVRSS